MWRRARVSAPVGLITCVCVVQPSPVCDVLCWFQTASLFCFHGSLCFRPSPILWFFPWLPPFFLSLSCTPPHHLFLFVPVCVPQYIFLSAPVYVSHYLFLSVPVCVFPITSFPLCTRSLSPHPSLPSPPLSPPISASVSPLLRLCLLSSSSLQPSWPPLTRMWLSGSKLAPSPAWSWTAFLRRPRTWTS